jgi:hypothetical protein
MTPVLETAPSRTPVASRLRRAVAWVERERLSLAVPLLFGCLYLAIVRKLLSQDGYLALVAGRDIVHHGLPDFENLTLYAHGVRWVDQPWLAQIAMYGLTRIGGLPLLALVHVGMAMVVVAIAVVVARRGGARPASVMAVALIAFVPVSYVLATIRTEIFGAVACAVVFALLVMDARRPSARVWAVVPVLVLWANLHGSVPLGAGLAVLRGLTLAFEPPTRRRGIAFAVCCGLAVAASPYVSHLPEYYHHTAFNREFGRVVGEWRPTTPSLATAPYYLLVFLGVWAYGRRPDSLTAWEWIALLLTAVAGMAASRNAGWYALLAIMTLPTVLWTADRERRGRLSGLPIVAAPLLLLVVLAVTTAVRAGGWFATEYPSGPAHAVERIASREPQARIFADVRFADWLLWRKPTLAGRVAFDARFELLTKGQLEAIRAFNGQRGDDWVRAANGYRVVVLDEPRDGAIARSLLAQPGSELAYGGPGGTVIALGS